MKQLAFKNSQNELYRQYTKDLISALLIKTWNKSEINVLCLDRQKELQKS